MSSLLGKPERMKLIYSLLLTAFTLGNVFAQKTIDAESFTSISLKTSATVYVTQGNTFKVELEGDDDALEDADVFVRGDKLIIDSDDDWSWFGNSGNDLTVHVTCPKLNGVSVSGSGKLYAKGKFTTDELDLSVSGSGRMELDADASDTYASVSGSGRIYLKGSTGNIKVSVSGSGRINGEDFKARECKASISGSGSCEIYVEESLDVRISGSGSVYYGGNPDHVDSHTSGSGRVKKI